MDAEFCLNTLYERIHTAIMERDGKLRRFHGFSGDACNALAEITRHTELLAMELRELLLCCHSELQALGECPKQRAMPDAPGIQIEIDPPCARIIVDGILPYPLKGGVHYLHSKLDDALSRHFRDNVLPRPLFEQRCAVVFLHRYTGTSWRLRHIRDYDNVEHRCITNVITRHFLPDDTPACYIGMDILAPGDVNQTEIRLMPIPAFQAFVASGEIAYLP